MTRLTYSLMIMQDCTELMTIFCFMVFENLFTDGEAKSK